MASPQTENGYTKIANELLESIFRARFKATECAVILWIARNSYGWSRKKTNEVGVRQMARDMGTPYPSVRLALEILLEHGVISRDEKGRLSINKDYESWVLPGSPVNQKVVNPLTNVVNPLTNVVNPLTINGSPVNQSTDGPKERKKEKESVKGGNDQNGDTNTPSLSEIVEYAQELNKPMDCRRFFDHYTANGWRRGKGPIADWKAVVRLWQDDGSHEEKKHYPPKPEPMCDDCHKERPIGEDGGKSLCERCYIKAVS